MKTKPSNNVTKETMRKNKNKRNDEKKEKKIFFDPETDDRIDNLSITSTFIVVGLFLQFTPTYFGHPIITSIFKIIFVFFGFIMIVSEIKKSKNKIKGLDFGFMGILILLAFYAICVLWQNVIANSLAFVLLIFGLFAFFFGFYQVIYSIKAIINKRNEDGKQSKGDILLFITKVFGLVLVILQLAKFIAENVSKNP